MRRVHAVIAAATAFGATLLAPEFARAEPYVVAAPEGWLVFPDGSGPTLGGGLAAVGGLGLDYDPLLVAPQLALGGHVLLSEAVPDLNQLDPFFDTQEWLLHLRATAGGSIGIAAAVEVAVYARAGVGLASSLEGPSSSAGLALDAGLSLDRRVDRDFTIGGQLGYAGFVATNDDVAPFHAITLGPRFGFWF